jgi:hypothetical protein
MNMDAATENRYEEKVLSLLQAWSGGIDMLKRKAEEADPNDRIRYYTHIVRILKRQAIVRRKLLQLQEAGEAARERLQAYTEQALEELKRALNRALDEAAAKSLIQ